MSVRFLVTGFSTFGEVHENPTERLVQRLSQNLNDEIQAEDYSLAGTHVLPVSANFLRTWVPDVCYAHVDDLIKDDHVVVVHLGVDEKSNKFKLEQVAINEATFRIPDDGDWQPREEPIDARESMTAIQSTRIDVQGLAVNLSAHPIEVSMDAGRYVCNYLYYRSLVEASQRTRNVRCLFVHVPPFRWIDEELQFNFLLDLLSTLAKMPAS